MDKTVQFMKNIYLWILLLWSCALDAQTTIATNHTITTNAYFYANWGLTFNVQNTSTTARVRLKALSSAHSAYSSGQAIVQVWYRTTPINQATTLGAISTANGWTSAGITKISNVGVGVSQWFANLNLDIPPSSNYGICITSSNSLGCSFPGAPGANTFTSAPVNLITGQNISWGGPLTGPNNTQTLLVGGIGYDTLPLCNGTISAGQIDAIQGFCGSQAKTYNLKNHTQGWGITYQWLVSTTSPSGPWSAVGTSIPFLNRTINATTYYRCALSCPYSGSLDTTPVFADTLNPFYYCYCASSPSLPTETKIDSFSFLNVATASNSNTCEMYTDYRGQIVAPKLRLGTTLTASIKDGSCITQGLGDFGVIYLDMNRNGTYETSERLGGGAFSIGTGQWATKTMAIPLTNVIGITGLRAMIYNGTAPTTACSPTATNSWGETEDYLVEIIQDPIDANMNSILSNVNDKCSATTDTVKFNVTNIGSGALNPLTVSYSVNGGTPVTETFGMLTSGATGTYSFSTLANYTGLYNVTLKVWAAMASDTNHTNDTLVAKFINFVTPPVPDTQSPVACNGSPLAILRATSIAPNLTRWYSDASGLNEVGKGNMYLIPNPTASATFYAKSVIEETRNFGLTSYSPEGFVSGNTSGNIFDIQRNKVRINTVKVKFNTAGSAGIEIRNAANTLLGTASYAVNTPGEYIIPINITLPVGTGYRIILAQNPGTVAATVGYNSYPIGIPNVIQITNSIVAGGYNTFYDWNVTYDACSSPIVPVNLTYISGVASPLRVLKPYDTVCQSPMHELDAQNIGCTYTWQDNSTNRYLLAMTTGVYSVVIKNATGCTVEDTSRVLVKTSPQYTLGLDSTICAGDKITLATGYSNYGYNHDWGKYYQVGPTVLSPYDWVDSSIHTGQGIKFDVLRDSVMIEEVRAIFQSINDTAYIRILDDAGNTIFSKKHYVRAAGVPTIVPINAYVRSGSRYELILDSMYMPNSKIVRKTSFSGFPFSIANVIALTGSTDGTSNYNYFFDWKVSHHLPDVQTLDTRVEVGDSGLYFARVYNTGIQCGYRAFRKVDLVPKPSVYLGRDTSVCSKDSVKLSVPNNPNYSYVWDNGSTSNTRAVTSSQKVWLRVQDNSSAFACKNTDTVVVSISTLTKPYIGLDKVTCNATETIGIPDTPGRIYRWSSGETTSESTQKLSGMYVLSVSESGTTCTFSDTVQLTFVTAPDLSLGSSIQTCAKKLTLRATKGWTNYTWSPGGGGTDSLNITPPSGTYSVTASKSPCPPKSVSINVTFVDSVFNLTLPPDTIICAPLTLSVPSQPTGNVIKWSDGSLGTSMTVNETGNYWVTINNACGNFSDAIQVIKDTIPVVDFSYTATDRFVAFENLSVNGYSYLWDFGEDNNTSTNKNTSYLYDTFKEVTVTLTVKNYCGQEEKTTKTIVLKENNSALVSANIASVEIYPNPAKDVVYIRNLDKTFRAKVQIHSMDGKLAYSSDQMTFNKAQDKSIDITNLTSGHYMISIQSDKQFIQKKISITK